MRKFFWVILAAMSVGIAAPAAHADDFTYTYSATFQPVSDYGATFTTGPMAAVTMSTTILAPDLASSSLTGSWWTGAIDFVILDYGLCGGQEIHSTTGKSITSCDGFSASDYSSPGTYISPYGTLMVNESIVSGTPEPATFYLFLSGLGLIGLMLWRPVLIR